MRQRTQAAILFGALLHDLRREKEMSMGQVARKLGVPSATVSQSENGQRAVKEPKLIPWANALGVDESFLRDKWLAFQKEFPAPPITRRRDTATTPRELLTLLDSLDITEKNKVAEYIHRLIEERP